MALTSRFFEDPSHHYFLFGPRGTGKTTWLKSQYPQALWLDLLDPQSYRSYAARPERLAQLIAGAGPNPTVVIDEVQRVPELLNVVHAAIESNSVSKFVLTGSSARKLKREGVNLLAGRAWLRAMHPFMAAELGEAFNLEHALHHGLLPLVYQSPDPWQSLNAYVDLYLKEEVQQEGLVRDIGHFSRFLEACSFSHANVWNAAEVSRQSEVSRKSVTSYVEILEDLLLAARVPIFSKRAKRALSKHQKFYFFDAGVFRAARPRGPLDSQEELAGAALEGLVAQHVRAWIDYSQNSTELFFWRTKAKSEIDFVVYGPDTFVALEVKHSTKVHSKMLRTLKTFAQDYPEAELRLLYRGHETLKIDNVLCIPVDQYLMNIVPGRPLP